jgi:DNA-binding MarR family transcriptional regulator
LRYPAKANSLHIYYILGYYLERRKLPSYEPPLCGNAQENEERQFGWMLHDVFRLFQRSWSRRLRNSGLGISPAQSRVLTEVYRQAGLTQTSLADSVEMEKAPLGRLLDRLEEMGLVERKPDPADRRARLVFYTDKAKALDEPMWGIARGIFEAAFDGLSAAERTQLLSLLDRLKQNLLAEEASANALPRSDAEENGDAGK